MEHWQFLIQKQGDRSWHTLESPNLEILAGRYRVLARSNRPNIDVEVRVIYSSPQEVPPQKRVQRRSRRTNSEGLMAVIPFTHLNPGIWELRCSGDLMSDMLGKSWQHSIRMEVLPLTQDVRNYHHNYVGSTATETEGIIHNTITITAEPVITIPSHVSSTVLSPKKKYDDDALIDAPISPVWVRGETAEQILQNLLELALPATQPLKEDVTVDEPLVEPPPPLLITLDEENYIARWGETLNLNARVELKEIIQDETSELESVCAAEIRVEMRSPHKSEILNSIRQPQSEKILPCTISSSIQIPADCESNLILADISLYGALAGVGEVTLLGSQSFIITADVTQLLAITTAREPSKPSDYQLAPIVISQPKPSSLDLELFNLVKAVKSDQALVFHPSVKKSLPPRIEAQAFKKSTFKRSLNLPNFSGKQNSALASSVVSQGSSKLDDLENTISEEHFQLHKTSSTTFRYLTRLKALPGDTQEVKNITHENVQLDAIVATEENPPELVLSALVEDNSFVEVVIPQSSQLITEKKPYTSPLIQKWMQTQGYFLSEANNIQPQYYTDIPTKQTPLNAIADVLPVPVDITKEDTQIQAQEDISEQSQLPLQIPPLPPPRQPKIPPIWVAREIVVDDTPHEIEAEATQNDSLEQKPELVPLSVSLAVAAANWSSLPIPQLHVPEGELIAGKSVRVRVHLPFVREQLAVKLWMEDCQTRWLLDAPHLLKNLLPNHAGELEVMTQLNIPFGCLEIRIEAIAIDTTTQQESHKVTIRRSVIPPDLPTLQLNEILSM